MTILGLLSLAIGLALMATRLLFEVASFEEHGWRPFRVVAVELPNCLGEDGE
jgi:hypothetical protein